MSYGADAGDVSVEQGSFSWGHSTTSEPRGGLTDKRFALTSLVQANRTVVWQEDSKKALQTILGVIWLAPSL